MCRTDFSRASGIGAIALALVLASAGTPRAATAAVEGCDNPSHLCLESSDGAKWRPGKRMTAKEKKAKRKGAPSTMSLTIEGGRGSVFVDGRWAGTAPVESFELAPGPHDLQIRDGDAVLAQGVIDAPKSGGTLEIVVAHG